MKIPIKNPLASVLKVSVAALCALLAGGFFSCSKRLDGEVPNKPCECPGNKPMNASHAKRKGDAYIFDGYPSDELREKLFSHYDLGKGEFVYYFVVERKYDFVWMVRYESSMFPDIIKVCNFPDFAKAWEIPEEGLKVNFAGSFHRTCEWMTLYVFEERELSFSTEIVLTQLKKK